MGYNCHLVYVLSIVGTNTFKVGKTSCLSYRLKNLRQSLYQDSAVIRTIVCPTTHDANRVEKRLHRLLEYCRLRGEWYDCPHSQLDNIISQHVLCTVLGSDPCQSTFIDLL